MSQPSELVEALSPIVLAFRRLNVRHYIGGSIASSFHGAVRSTLDVDLVCELTEDKITAFVDSLGADYYYSVPAIEQAVDQKSCFNLIHLPTSFKVDVFISRGRQFDRACMERATIEQLGEGQLLSVSMLSAEDSIISKLEWYQLGGEVSERQWDDVLQLIRLHGDRLDVAYLRSAASSVGVNNLLERLLNER